MEHRLEPLKEPFPPEVAGILERYPKRDGYILELFRVFANSTRFLSKGVANLLDKDSPLPVRLREIVILRVTANTNCEYEWGVHVAAFADYAGFSSEQIEATRLGDSTSPCWSGEESLAIEVVDELCATGSVGEGVRARFQQTWTAEQQLEVLALCGNYHTISFVANTARLAGESFGAKFPG